jgi:inactivation no afterpotential D protein
MGFSVIFFQSGGGLGIMIMEGRHAELGQGIFISDIQEGSVAELAGLFVGDMILSVNQEDMVGCDYENVSSIQFFICFFLKKLFN